MHYKETEKDLRLDPKKTLLASLRTEGYPVPFSCGGEGICTTCRVVIQSGEVTPRTSLEAERAQERQFAPEERLSCQCYPCGDSLEIEIP